jgi:hypothetical protein
MHPKVLLAAAIELFSWIRNCRQGTGIAAGQILGEQTLLSVLHDIDR